MPFPFAAHSANPHSEIRLRSKQIGGWYLFSAITESGVCAIQTKRFSDLYSVARHKVSLRNYTATGESNAVKQTSRETLTDSSTELLRTGMARTSGYSFSTLDTNALPKLPVPPVTKIDCPLGIF